MYSREFYMKYVDDKSTVRKDILQVTLTLTFVAAPSRRTFALIILIYSSASATIGARRVSTGIWREQQEQPAE